MANISTYIAAIESAARGEEVRTAIVNALEAMNNEGADTVNGHTVESDVPANAAFTDTTYSAATTTADGLMTTADKTKLDGLPTPAASDSGKYLRVDSSGDYVLVTVPNAEGVSF